MVNTPIFCPNCGFESPDNARFCRQCGVLLLAESEEMEAATRNYGRQGPAVATAGSAPLPPSIGDAVAGDTARYQHPVWSAAPVYAPPSMVAHAPKTGSLKSKWRFLKWGGFALALLISGGIGAGINHESNRSRVYLSLEDRIRLERLRIEDRIQQTLTGSISDYQDRVLQQQERRLDEIVRLQEEANRKAERGDLTPTGDKLLDLTGYEYQGASAGQYSRIPGKEMLTQRTKDDFEMVIRFYQEKLGKPFVQVSERNLKQALFQSPGAPLVTVLVRETRDRPRQLEILILRSPFRFPGALSDQEPPKAGESLKPQ